MLKLVSEYDPILRTRCEIIPEINDEFRDVVDQMSDLMLEKNGIGLAAPQVGLPWRMFIIRTSETDIIPVVNPKIISHSNSVSTDKEGCLSFPNLVLSIKRPEEVRVSYTAYDGEEVTVDLSGINARCLLHELDHINGVVFTDLVPKTKLLMAKSKRKRR